MATNGRHQALAEHHIRKLRTRPDEVKTARRRTTDDRDHARNHDQNHNADTFTTVRRATHTNNHTHAFTRTRTPAPKHQSSTRYQRASTSAGEEYQDNPFQDHIHTYKTQLVDDLNAQMNDADDEITQCMDELSGEFEERLKVIEKAGGMFWSTVGDERVEIGTIVLEDEGDENRKEEIALEQVMADLESLMEEKRERLKVLTEEYTRVRQESVKLAITILGEDKVSLVESASASASESIEEKIRNTKRVINEAREGTSNPGLNVDMNAAKNANDSFEQVYDDTEGGLTDLQTTLDELVVKNLEENKGALKAFQAGRKVKQGELSKLLSTWSFC